MSRPKVSVIAPAKGAARTIAAAVESALAQEYAGEVEVIVAIPPGDDTAAALDGIDGPLKVVPNPSGRTPDALNRALAAATGEVIARLDAHAVLPPGYLARAVETLERTGADNVGGVQEPVADGFFQRAVAIAQSSPFGVGDARYRLGGPEGPTDTVYLGVFRRRALERLGGFDPDLERNQDYELNWRIRRQGGLVWFDPALRVAYRPRGRVGALARQYFEYGRWKRLVVRRHPRSLRWRQLAPPALVVALVGSGAGLATRWRGAAAVVPLAYLGALVAASVWEGVRRRQPAAVALPVALATMHLSWGVGFLLGPLRRRPQPPTNAR